MVYIDLDVPAVARAAAVVPFQCHDWHTEGCWLVAGLLVLVHVIFLSRGAVYVHHHHRHNLQVITIAAWAMPLDLNHRHHHHLVTAAWFQSTAIDVDVDGWL